MQFHEWTVKIRVPGYAVAQGNVIEREALEVALEQVLTAVHDGDLETMIIKAPSAEAIQQEQA